MCSEEGLGKQQFALESTSKAAFAGKALRMQESIGLLSGVRPGLQLQEGRLK